VNQLGAASSARDRLNIGYFTWNPVDQIIQEPTLHVRYNDLKVIAGVMQISLLYVRRDTPPGLAKPADIARAPLIRVGALGPTNRGWIRMRLALELLGAKYEAIPGYKGLSDIDLALQRNDVQMSTNALSGYFASTKPSLIDTGIAIPLLQYDRADGLPGRSPDLPDVPTFLEVYKEIHGKNAMPTGEKWQALQLLTRILDSMFRTVFMAPAAPAAAVEEMRGAFAKLGADPEFIAQYEKVAFSKLRFIMGAEAERIIAELGTIQPSMVDFLRKYIQGSR
jgi:tripartite-type tricarboxylate transporter receptor subunit TctC